MSKEITKPKYTEPCNHCGLCCKSELCQIAKMALPTANAPCPAITELDGKFLCGFVLTEQHTKLPPMIQQSLGIGCGCSMPDEDTTELEMLVFNEHSYQKMRTLVHYEPSN